MDERPSSVTAEFARLRPLTCCPAKWGRAPGLVRYATQRPPLHGDRWGAGQAPGRWPHPCAADGTDHFDTPGGHGMAVVTMRQLLESGVHFGHQTRRWNPKMKRFIMTERNGIYIIDLQQSLAYIDRSYAFIKETVAKGGTIMFVGTKKQAQEAIAEQATRVGMPYVNQRGLGGMLTNFQTVHQRINRMKELETMEQTG